MCLEADDSDATVLARIQRQSAARFFGMQGVKINILRACINFCGRPFRLRRCPEILQRPFHKLREANRPRPAP